MLSFKYKEIITLLVLGERFLCTIIANVFLFFLSSLRAFHCLHELGMWLLLFEGQDRSRLASL